MPTLLLLRKTMSKDEGVANLKVYPLLAIVSIRMISC